MLCRSIISTSLFFLTLALFTATALTAQRPRVDIFRLDEGLQSTALYDLDQSEDGRLWILTRSGIAIYDGRRFTAPIAGTPPMDLGRIVIDDQDKIWVAPVNFGAALFRLERPDTSTWWKAPPIPGEFRNYDGLMSAFAATTERAAIGSLRYGILLWDDGWQHLVQEDGLINSTIFSLHALRQEIFVGTGSGLCQLLESAVDCSLARTDLRLQEPILAMTSVPGPSLASSDQKKERLWLLTPRHAGYLDEASRFVPVLSAPDLPQLDLGVSTLAVGPGESFVIGNRQRAFLMDPETPLRLGLHAGLPNEGSTKSLYDREGNLWLAGTRGLAKIESLRFLTWDQSQGLPEDEVASLLELSPGRMLLGHNTSFSLITDREGSSPTVEHLPIELSYLDVRVARVLDLERDRNGIVWAAAADIGLISFDPDDPSRQLKILELDDSVFSVETDTKGDLWVLTLKGLWKKRDGALRAKISSGDPSGAARFEKIAGQPKGAVMRWLTFSRDGEPMISTRRGILVLNEASGTWTRIEGPNLATNDIFRVLVRPDGRTLAATSGGLCEMLDDRLVPVDTGYQGAAYSLLVDDQERIWLGTGDGVRIWDGEQLRHLTVRHGLAGRETNRGAALVDHRGRTWIGTARGVSVYRQDYDIPRKVPPGVRLGALLIGERSWPLDQEIRLAPDQHDFRLHFRTIAFARDEELLVRYKLDGFDEEWTQTPLRDDTFRYTNVPAGEYVFRVAVGRGGYWSEEVSSAKIFVTRPLWREPVFQGFATILFVGLIFAAHRFRVYAISRHAEELQDFNRRLRQTVREKERAESDRERLIVQLENKNSELEQFTRTVSHDLKAPLVTIRGFAGLARRDAERGKSQRLGEDLDRIDDSVEKMQYLIDDLLELSRGGDFVHEPQPVDLAETAREAVALLAGDIEASRAIVRVHEELPVVMGDHIRLLQVFQNLIGNAVKFLEDDSNRRIEVGCELKEQSVLCHVRDHGPGIASKDLDKVFELFERLGSSAPGTGVGLSLVKRIIEVHNGRIWAESEGLGHGTTFYFSLPMKVRQP